MNTTSFLHPYFLNLNHPANKKIKKKNETSFIIFLKKIFQLDKYKSCIIIKTFQLEHYIPLLYQVAMSVPNRNIEKLLKELDPTTLQALEQLLAEDAPAVRKIIHNILDEPISEKVEKSLDKPLLPKPFQPTAPSRKRRGRKIQEILRKFNFSREYPKCYKLSE